jgi:hypothetical protein
MLKSKSFWDGFWSVWNPFGLIFTAISGDREHFRRDYSHSKHADEFESLAQNIEKRRAMTPAEQLADNWRTVEGYLWRAMNQFEQEYGGDKDKTFTEDVPSSVEILARFEMLAKEYDAPVISVRCSNCGAEKKVGKYHAQAYTLRCVCCGIMVCGTS